MDSSISYGLLSALTDKDNVRQATLGDRDVRYVEYHGYALGITSDNIITVMDIEMRPSRVLFSIRMLDEEYNLADAMCLASVGIKKDGIYEFL